MLSWLRTRQAKQLKAAELYGAVVTQARNPAFFAVAGVADTPEGRLEVIVLHLYLALERLRALGNRGVETSRMLIEAFVSDIDDQMREVGVSDLAVPKKVRRAASLLYERAGEYRRALEAGDDAALAAALARALPEAAAATPALARYVRQAAAHLASQEGLALEGGMITFPVPQLDHAGEQA